MKKIPLGAVARSLGVSDNTLRAGLRQGKYPFGTAFKSKEDNRTYVYVLYPKKVQEYIGEIEEAFGRTSHDH